jgi:dinuclear metal center YbgI/SA1388 family protein
MAELIIFEPPQSSTIMTKIKDIIHYLETIAPPPLQEDYDNSGLLTGNPETQIKGVMVALDCTEQVVYDAAAKGCNLIIAHHPIIFRGLKKLTGRNYIERTIILSIKKDIAIYAIHTNLDNVMHGVNGKIAEKLQLNNLRILRPKSNVLNKLTTFIPKESTDAVMEELHAAGAGMIGDYKKCSFRLEGTGTFLPTENANPAIGKLNQLEKVKEDRVEVIFPAYLKSKVLATLFKAHPYEEVAYYLHTLENTDQQVGSGMIGTLKQPIRSSEILAYIKEKLNAQMIRHTALVKEKVETIAICGGAGSFLLGDAIAQGADVFVTGDFKYHEFFDADGKIVIADVGHYESEQFTKELIYEKLTEKFANIALHFTEVITNPIFYA